MDTCFIKSRKGLPLFEGFGIDNDLDFGISDPAAHGVFFDRGPENVPFGNDLAFDGIEGHCLIALCGNTGAVENIVPDLHVCRIPDGKGQHSGIHDGVVQDPDMGTHGGNGVIAPVDDVVLNDRPRRIADNCKLSCIPAETGRMAVADRHISAPFDSDDPQAGGGFRFNEGHTVNDDVTAVLEVDHGRMEFLS